MSVKINAYKVKNLSKVDIKQYKDGDHFITDRSIGILMNGKIVNLLGGTDHTTDINQIKQDILDIIERLEVLEG